MSNALALRDFSWGLPKFLNTGVFDFRTVLKIHYRLSLVYFDTKEVVKVGTGLEGLAKSLEK